MNNFETFGSSFDITFKISKKHVKEIILKEDIFKHIVTNVVRKATKMQTFWRMLPKVKHVSKKETNLAECDEYVVLECQGNSPYMYFHNLGYVMINSFPYIDKLNVNNPKTKMINSIEGFKEQFALYKKMGLGMPVIRQDKKTKPVFDELPTHCICIIDQPLISFLLHNVKTHMSSNLWHFSDLLRNLKVLTFETASAKKTAEKQIIEFLKLFHTIIKDEEDHIQDFVLSKLRRLLCSNPKPFVEFHNSLEVLYAGSAKLTLVEECTGHLRHKTIFTLNAFNKIILKETQAQINSEKKTEFKNFCGTITKYHIDVNFQGTMKTIVYSPLIHSDLPDNGLTVLRDVNSLTGCSEHISEIFDVNIFLMGSTKGTLAKLIFDNTFVSVYEYFKHPVHKEILQHNSEIEEKVVVDKFLDEIPSKTVELNNEEFTKLLLRPKLNELIYNSQTSGLEDYMYEEDEEDSNEKNEVSYSESETTVSKIKQKKVSDKSDEESDEESESDTSDDEDDKKENKAEEFVIILHKDVTEEVFCCDYLGEEDEDEDEKLKTDKFISAETLPWKSEPTDAYYELTKEFKYINEEPYIFDKNALFNVGGMFLLMLSPEIKHDVISLFDSTALEIFIDYIFNTSLNRNTHDHAVLLKKCTNLAYKHITEVEECTTGLYTKQTLLTHMVALNKIEHIDYETYSRNNQDFLQLLNDFIEYKTYTLFLDLIKNIEERKCCFGFLVTGLEFCLNDITCRFLVDDDGDFVLEIKYIRPEQSSLSDVEKKLFTLNNMFDEPILNRTNCKSLEFVVEI